MNKHKLYEEWRSEQLKDPNILAALEELEPAYQAARLHQLRRRQWRLVRQAGCIIFVLGMAALAGVGAVLVYYWMITR